MIADSSIVLVAGSVEARDTLQHEFASSGVRVLAGVSTAELRDAMGALIAAAHERDERAHMIVHNLKTPLTTILATAEMLVDGDMGALMERQRAAIQEIKDTGEQLLRLIEDLLDTWLLESPGHSLAMEEIDPAALLERLERAWQPRFARGGHVVRMQIATPVAKLVGDRLLITRVLENLLENALTHGGKGVALELAVTSPSDSEVMFSVRDSGAGIPEDQQERIFEKFTRLTSPEKERRGGSGLGLAFCRLAVSAHGGSIDVISKPGDGSTFVVRLPTRPPARDQTP